ncbi:MAG: VOC family protein [Actinomycetota bacterium]|nr:VOC family protein [Actinomycetota bacterium]
MDPVSLSLHHTAIVVRNLDRSIAFYERFFGGRVETILRDVDDPQIAQLHDLEDARFTLAFVRFGPTRLELFQFERPTDGRSLPDRANDFGVRHICFEVPNLAETYKRMKVAGVRFTRPPYTVPDSEASGTVLAFCADPDGTRVELLQPGRELGETPGTSSITA